MCGRVDEGGRLGHLLHDPADLAVLFLWRAACLDGCWWHERRMPIKLIRIHRGGAFGAIGSSSVEVGLDGARSSGFLGGEAREHVG